MVRREVNKKVLALFAFGIIILSLGFLIAAAPVAPTGILFSQNDTANYDNDGTVFLNWTAGSDNFNYTIFVGLSGETAFTNAKNDSVTGYTFTNDTDGNYTFIIQAQNSTATDACLPAGEGCANTTENTWILIDTTNPALAYSSVGTETNASYKSRDWIFVNTTASDTYNDTLVFNLYYSANGTLVNSTSYSSYTTTTVNWTGLSEGTYIFNVTANDSATNENSTASRTVTLDTTAPTVSSMTLSSSSSQSIVISFSAGGTCTSNRGTISGTTLTDSNLNCGYSYDYTITCSDSAGNSGSKTQTFYTLGCGSSSSSSSSSSLNTWKKSVIETDEDLSLKGVLSESLGEKERLRFIVENQNHHVGILDVVGSEKVLVVVESEPQEENFTVGETKKFEVTGDNYYDVLVRLVSIENGKARLEVSYIHEFIEEPSTDAPAEEEDTSTGETPGSEAPQGEEQSESSGSWTWLWIVIAILVLAALYWLVFVKEVFSKKRR